MTSNSNGVRRYRKKPVVIEARHFIVGENPYELAGWCDGRVADNERTILIKTLEGTMAARDGDWIICGVKGEFYPCAPDIFEATYEEV